MKARTVIAGLLLLGLTELALRAPARHRFVVTNESGQAVRDLVVEIGPDDFRYADLPPSGKASASFRFDHEATFRVRGHLADGTAFDDFVGYVVWEDWVVRSHIVIGPGGKVDYHEWQFP